MENVIRVRIEGGSAYALISSFLNIGIAQKELSTIANNAAEGVFSLVMELKGANPSLEPYEIKALLNAEMAEAIARHQIEEHLSSKGEDDSKIKRLMKAVATARRALDKELDFSKYGSIHSLEKAVTELNKVDEENRIHSEQVQLSEKIAKKEGISKEEALQKIKGATHVALAARQGKGKEVAVAPTESVLSNQVAIPEMKDVWDTIVQDLELLYKKNPSQAKNMLLGFSSKLANAKAAAGIVVGPMLSKQA